MVGIRQELNRTFWTSQVKPSKMEFMNELQPHPKSTQLWPIYLVIFVDILGYTIILPVLPFLAQSLGASELIVGSLVASFAAAQLLAGPLLGYLSDRWGRKPILIISQVGTFLSFVMLAYSQRLEWIFVARILDGMTAGNIVVAQAAISDVTPAKDRFKAFGVIGIAFGLGFFLGPLISGIFSKSGYQVPALIAAGLSFLSLALTVFVYRETKLDTTQVRKLRLSPIQGLLDIHKNPDLRHLMLSFFLFNFAFSGMIVGLPMVLEKTVTWKGETFDARHVGWFYAYLGLLGILVQTRILKAVVQTIGEAATARLGAVLQGVGIALYAVVKNLATALGASSISNVGSGLTRPTLTSLITQKAPPQEQGEILGLSQSLASIATIVAPILAGALIGTGAIWAWALVFGASACLGYFTCPRD